VARGGLRALRLVRGSRMRRGRPRPRGDALAAVPRMPRRALSRRIRSGAACVTLCDPVARTGAGLRPGPCPPRRAGDRRREQRHCGKHRHDHHGVHGARREACAPVQEEAVGRGHYGGRKREREAWVRDEGQGQVDRVCHTVHDGGPQRKHERRVARRARRARPLRPRRTRQSTPRAAPWRSGARRPWQARRAASRPWPWKRRRERPRPPRPCMPELPAARAGRGARGLNRIAGARLRRLRRGCPLDPRRGPSMPRA